MDVSFLLSSLYTREVKIYNSVGYYFAAPGESFPPILEIEVTNTRPNVLQFWINDGGTSNFPDDPAHLIAYPGDTVRLATFSARTTGRAIPVATYTDMWDGTLTTDVTAGTPNLQSTILFPRPWPEIAPDASVSSNDIRGTLDSNFKIRGWDLP